MVNLHQPKLSAAFVKDAKPGKYTDGHGLMLLGRSGAQGRRSGMPALPRSGRQTKRTWSGTRGHEHTTVLIDTQRDKPGEEKGMDARKHLCNAALTTAVMVGAATSNASQHPVVEELRALHTELQEFKFSTEFQEVGFGPCCKYYKWMKRVQALEGTDWKAAIDGFGILPGELITLAQEYRQGDLESVAWWEQRIAAATSPVTEEREHKVKEPDGTIGEWERHSQMLGTTKYRIERVTGNLQLHVEYEDGSASTDKVQELEPTGVLKRRFVDPENTHGEYFGIRADGSLEYYDPNGRIFTAPSR